MLAKLGSASAESGAIRPWPAAGPGQLCAGHCARTIGGVARERPSIRSEVRSETRALKARNSTKSGATGVVSYEDFHAEFLNESAGQVRSKRPEP